MVEMLNRDVIPVVPEQGSLGASGDLAPLANLALPLIGHGEVLGADDRRSPPPTRSRARACRRSASRRRRASRSSTARRGCSRSGSSPPTGSCAWRGPPTSSPP
jgi:hypothetical protein